MDQEELQYWMSEYPELEEDEIIDILEACDADESTRFSDYVSDGEDPEPAGLQQILRNIIGNK